MAIQDTITAITRRVAQTRNPNVWMDADVVFRKLAKPTLEAGDDIQVPVKVFAHPTEMYRGLTPATLDTTDFQRAFIYPWRLGRAPVVYDGESILKNNGNAQALVKLVTSQLENSEDSLTNKMVEMFFGAQTDATTDFNSFQHLANDTANALGTGVTLGGLSKVTYPRLSGKVLDVGGTGIGFVYQHAARGLALVMDGMRQPDLYVARPETLMTFSTTQQGQQRWSDTDALTAGFVAYNLFGRPFYAQRHVPYHVSTFANNRVFGIDTKALKCVIHKDRNFILEPFVKLQGQDGWSSFRMVAGNFITDDPQRFLVYRNFDPAATTAS